MKDTAAALGHVPLSKLCVGRTVERHRGAVLRCKRFRAGEAVCRLACFRRVLSAEIRAWSKADIGFVERQVADLQCNSLAKFEQCKRR